MDDPAAIAARRQLIRSRPFLRRVYNEWYDVVIQALPTVDGAVLELGSGCGFLEERIPGLITSDLSAAAPVRVALDAQAMPIGDGALRAVVLTNVLHHLPRSRRFLREAARAVRTGGRLIMIEPWVSPWSAFVYRHLHHEPFMPDAATWEFPEGGPLSAANIAVPWIVFARDRARFEQEFPQWRIRSLTPAMPFRYFISGGVSARLSMPAATYGAWTWLERRLERWGEWWASFVYIVLERTDAAVDGGPTPAPRARGMLAQ